jgi:hypothetical protein
VGRFDDDSVPAFVFAYRASDYSIQSVLDDANGAITPSVKGRIANEPRDPDTPTGRTRTATARASISPPAIWTVQGGIRIKRNNGAWLKLRISSGAASGPGISSVSKRPFTGSRFRFSVMIALRARSARQRDVDKWY